MKLVKIAAIVALVRRVRLSDVLAMRSLGLRWTLPIATVGDGVISPNEARRYLGAGIGGAVRLGGSVFVVEAPLPGATFTFEGNKHRYYDGMYGYGEVVVRSEPILVKLLPGLKGLWGNK